MPVPVPVARPPGVSGRNCVARNSHSVGQLYLVHTFAIVRCEQGALARTQLPKGFEPASIGKLSRGSGLLMTTGNFGSVCARLAGPLWPLITPFRQVWFFSLATITTLLNRTGRRVLEIGHPGWQVPRSLTGYQVLPAFGVSAPSRVRSLSGRLLVNFFGAMRIIAQPV